MERQKYSLALTRRGNLHFTREQEQLNNLPSALLRNHAATGFVCDKPRAKHRQAWKNMVNGPAEGSERDTPPKGRAWARSPSSSPERSPPRSPASSAGPPTTTRTVSEDSLAQTRQLAESKKDAEEAKADAAKQMKQHEAKSRSRDDTRAAARAQAQAQAQLYQVLEYEGLVRLRPKSIFIAPQLARTPA
jgi:hypothetical protein